MGSQQLRKRLGRTQNGCERHRCLFDRPIVMGRTAGGGVRADIVRAADDRPDRIGAAGAVHQQRAAGFVAGERRSAGAVGWRMCFPQGAVPRKPLSGPLSKFHDPLRGEGALEVLPQRMGLGKVRLNVLPAAVAAAPLAAWNDALLAAQPSELAAGGGIDAIVHLPDQPLPRRDGKARWVIMKR